MCASSSRSSLTEPLIAGVTDIELKEIRVDGLSASVIADDGVQSLGYRHLVQDLPLDLKSNNERFQPLAHLSSLKAQRNDIALALALLEPPVSQFKKAVSNFKKKEISAHVGSGLCMMSIVTWSAIRIFQTVSTRNALLPEIEALVLPWVSIVREPAWDQTCSSESTRGTFGNCYMYDFLYPYYEHSAVAACGALIDTYCNIETVFGTKLSRDWDIFICAVVGMLIPLSLLFAFAYQINNRFELTRPRRVNISLEDRQTVASIARKHQIYDAFNDQGNLRSSIQAQVALQSYLNELNEKIEACELLIATARERCETFPMIFPENISECKGIMTLLATYDGSTSQGLVHTLTASSRHAFELGSHPKNAQSVSGNRVPRLYSFFQRLENTVSPDSDSKEIKRESDASEKIKILSNIYEFAGFMPIPKRL